jgi:hypothetical protein
VKPSFGSFEILIFLLIRRDVKSVDLGRPNDRHAELVIAQPGADKLLALENGVNGT